MAFPEVATILDDFNRANATPLDGNWSNGWYGNGNPNLSGSLVVNPGSGWIGSRYTGGPYGADVCVFATCPSGAYSGFVLYARVNGTEASPSGYGLVPAGGTNNAYFIKLNGSGGESQLGSAFSFASEGILANDRIGFRIVGNTLSAFRYTGGAWSASLHDETDSSSPWTGTGSLAFAWITATPNLDDFGGGTIGGAPADLNVAIVSSDSLYQVHSPKIVG